LQDNRAHLNWTGGNSQEPPVLLSEFKSATIFFDIDGDSVNASVVGIAAVKPHWKRREVIAAFPRSGHGRPKHQNPG